MQTLMRRIFGLPSPEEMRVVIEFLFEKPTAELTDFMYDVRDRSATLEAMESRVDGKLATLHAMEHRIAGRFKELEAAEEEMKRVAYGISVTIYDLVQAVQIEHGALGLTPEGKAILDFEEKEKPFDKP
jgi:hypothetical protein